MNSFYAIFTKITEILKNFVPHEQPLNLYQSFSNLELGFSRPNHTPKKKAGWLLKFFEIQPHPNVPLPHLSQYEYAKYLKVQTETENLGS